MNTSTYVEANSPVHACDARAKILLLLAFTICVFFAHTWLGILMFAVVTAAAIAASRVPLGNYFKPLVAVYVLMAFSVVCNMFVGDDAVAALGPLSISGSGLSRGCFLALRILMLCLASMVVTFTTTSTELTGGLGRMLGPLRHLHVPVDDITTVLSIALRFIPLIARQVEEVRDAHWSRGARFDGSLGQKLSAWGGVFLRVFVGMFRQADHLSAAMDSRGYATPGVTRTALSAAGMGAASTAALVCGLALLVAMAALL